MKWELVTLVDLDGNHLLGGRAVVLVRCIATEPSQWWEARTLDGSMTCGAEHRQQALDQVAGYAAWGTA